MPVRSNQSSPYFRIRSIQKLLMPVSDQSFLERAIQICRLRVTSHQQHMSMLGNLLQPVKSNRFFKAYEYACRVCFHFIKQVQYAARYASQTMEYAHITSVRNNGSSKQLSNFVSSTEVQTYTRRMKGRKIIKSMTVVVSPRTNECAKQCKLTSLYNLAKSITDLSLALVRFKIILVVNNQCYIMSWQKNVVLQRGALIPINVTFIQDERLHMLYRSISDDIRTQHHPHIVGVVSDLRMQHNPAWS